MIQHLSLSMLINTKEYHKANDHAFLGKTQLLFYFCKIFFLRINLESFSRNNGFRFAFNFKFRLLSVALNSLLRIFSEVNRAKEN